MARLPHFVSLALRIGALVGVILAGAGVRAQEARDWRLFTADDGLGTNDLSAVSLSSRGEVVFTHESGSVSSFDGYDFQSAKGWKEGEIAPPVGNYVSSSHRVAKDPSGALWTVYPGGLAECRDGVWLRHPVPDIQQLFKTAVFLARSRLNWVQPLGLGRALFVLPARLMEFDASKDGVSTWKLAAQTGLGPFSDLAAARESGLWIVGSNGVAKIAGHLDLLQQDAPWQEFHSPKDFDLRDFQRPFPDENGGLVALAEQGGDGRKVIVHFDGKDQWTVLEPPTPSVRWAWAGLEGSYWTASISQLYHREEKGGWVPVAKEAISAEHYLDAAVGADGVFWLATSSGAYRHSPPLWRHPPSWHPEPAAASAIFEDFEARLWCLQRDTLSREDDHGWSTFPIPRGAAPIATNGAAFPLADGSILLQLDDQILQFDPGLKRFSNLKTPDAARRKALGRLDSRRVCLQVLGAEPARGPAGFEYFDGKTLLPCRDIPGDLDLGKELRFVRLTQEGDLWVGGSSFVAERKQGGRWKVFSDPDANAPRGATSILEAGEGRIWVAAAGGVSQFDGKSWFPVPLPTGARGLKVVNAMARSADGRIWVASTSGLWRYFKDEWSSVSTEEGLPSASVLSVYEDSHGRIWAGATNGVSLYHPEADPDPPRTRISRVTAENRDSAFAQFFIQPTDRWKFTPPERLLYSYNLDGIRWAPYAPYRPGSTELDFPGLSPGGHVVFVRAMDRNWNVENLRQVAFSIPLPWYLDVRLIATSVAGLVAAAFFAVLALNRHLRLVRSYAEVGRMVALRTEQLEKANRGLLQSQKMNALGTLAAGVAHDFNNILSIIKGNAQIIETSLEDREKVRLRLSRIMTVVGQGAAIVKAMLGFSRESDQPTAPCDLNAVIQETIALLGDHALEHVQVEFDWAPGLPVIFAQKDCIQLVLMNFILNARDAMNGRGRVVLRTGETKSLPADLALAPEPAELHLFLSVKDFGAGISPEVRARIFEPFFTTKAFSSPRGTGLGLSMVYEMARHLGGGLQVESEPGKGSAFTLFLPVRAVPTTQPAR